LRHCSKSQKVAGSIPDGDIIRPAALWPRVNSASNKNQYHEYFLGGKGGRRVGLTTLPSSSADCLEIWETQPPGDLRACPGLYRDCSTFIKKMVRCSCYMSGVAQRVDSGTAVLFHDRGTRRGEWSASRPGRPLPPGKTRYPFYRRLVGPQGWSGRAENLVPTGIRSRTVQPVVIRLYLHI